MKCFSAYKSSEFSIKQKQKGVRTCFHSSRNRHRQTPYKQQAKTVIPRRMVIQTDTTLAVHEYIYNTDERHVLLSCLLLKLAISFLRIKVKNALFIYKAIFPASFTKIRFL